MRELGLLQTELDFRGGLLRLGGAPSVGSAVGSSPALGSSRAKGLLGKCPGAAVTKDHSLGLLKQQKSLLTVLGTGCLKSRCRQGRTPSEGHGDDPSCLFQLLEAVPAFRRVLDFRLQHANVFPVCPCL